MDGIAITFGIVPIVAGIDKFTDLLVDWDMYLNPQVASIVSFQHMDLCKSLEV